MSGKEIALLHGHIDASKRYLEFGSGESTIYAAGSPNILRIDSVESSAAFVKESLENNEAIARALVSGKLRFHIIDIGRSGAWGFPEQVEKQHLWPNYCLSVFARKSDHDMVLIDGRFRVACALTSFLSTPKGCRILIHDFPNRPQYHVVLRYFEVMDQADTMVVLAKKKDPDTRKIKALLRKYQYLPGDTTTAYKIRNRLLNNRIVRCLTTKRASSSP
jgi:hypothetical protein